MPASDDALDNTSEPQGDVPPAQPSNAPATQPSQANTSQTVAPKPKPKSPILNFSGTQETLKALEKLLNTRVLCYYTPSDVNINQNHPDIFLDQLGGIEQQDTLSLIIVSHGGDSSASLRIAYTLREYCKNLQVIVPTRCASAATVLALSADKIIMTSAGYLTAIDSSLFHPINPKGATGKPVEVSVDQVNRIVKFLEKEGPAKSDNYVEGSYRTLFKYIHPLTIGEIDRLSSRTILIAKMMMNMHPQSFDGPDKIAWIASHLYNDYPEHGFPILYQEALEIGLPVEKASRELTKLLRQLVNYYETAALEATTHYSENYYLRVANSTVIESVGKRTFFRSDYERRLNPTIKEWQVQNDYSQWLNIFPPPAGEKNIVIKPVDYVPLPEVSGR